MLRQLRENSRSVIIWVLFGIIIAFFVISFGPQASQDQFSCSGVNTTVGEVNGQEIPEQSWRFGLTALYAGSRAGSKEAVIDALIERELLAQAAETAGFRIADDVVDLAISRGDIFILSVPLRASQAPYIVDGVFDYEVLESWVGGLGLRSVAQFRAEQRRELLANVYRQVLLGAVRVSPEEVLTRYRNQNTTVTFDFVKFDPKLYERGLALTKDQTAQYLGAHEAEVKARFEQDERLYKGVSAQVRARHIFFKRETPVPPPNPAETEGEPPAEDDATLDPAHARATAARARVEGGEDFAKVAAALSEDDRTKDRGGDLGWRSVASLGWGPELSEAAKALEQGALSEVIATRRGFHVLIIDDKREGDLTFDQVKLEIAERLALELYGKEGARQDAVAALETATSSGKKLTELFPAPDVPAPTFPEGVQPTPLQLPPAPKTGMLVHEGPVQLASFGPIAMQTPAAAEQAKVDPAAVRAPLSVPRPANLAPPVSASSGAMPRSSGGVLAGPGGRPYIGKSPELQRALFDDIEPGALGPKVYEVDDGFVIVQLAERSEPDMEQFDKQKSRLLQSLSGEKSQRILADWSARECRAVATAGDIAINPEYVTYYDQDGNSKPVTYKVCMSLLPPQ